MMRRVLAVVLFLCFAALCGIGGGHVIHLGLGLYALYLLVVCFASNSVMTVLLETLWD